MSRRTRPLQKSTVQRRKRIVTVITVEREVATTGPVYVAFGKVLRQLRQKAGMTQDEVAQKVGVGRTSIVNIEVARQRVLLSDLFDFARALGVKPQKLFALMTDELEG